MFRVSDQSFNSGFLNQVMNLQVQQNNLQNEASSGLDVTNPEDNPSVMTNVLNLQTSSAANTQYQSNIATLQSAATTSASAMNSLQTLTSQASEIAINATSGTASPTQLASYAAQVESLIQQAVQIGNTKDATGNYIFAGTASTTTPFTTTTNAAGNITAVTYNGNTSVAQTDISPSSTATAQVPGENNTGSGPPGLFADSRTGADLFSHLIALQQDLASGNTAAIASTDSPAITQDDNHVITQISANGVMQSALDAANTMATSQNTNIATEVSTQTNANMAQTLSELSQAQTAYEAALESGSTVMRVSLLNFLS